MNSSIELTNEQKDILLHTLGFNYTPRHERNFFATDSEDDFKILSSLSELELMQFNGFKFGEKVYSATQKGKDIAIDLYNSSFPK